MRPVQHLSTIVVNDDTDQVHEVRHTGCPIDDSVQFHCVFVKVAMQAVGGLEAITQTPVTGVQDEAIDHLVQEGMPVMLPPPLLRGSLDRVRGSTPKQVS